MCEITQEEAVVKFSELMNPFLSSVVIPPALVETVINFYSNFRVMGASLENCDDMLLLEWGVNRPFLISSFTDFRFLAHNAPNFSDRQLQWLGLTRQIFTPTDECVEFDAGAIALCTYLFFEEKSGSEPASELWISYPSELNDKLDEFLQNPFVANLVSSKPSLLNVFVTYIG